MHKLFIFFFIPFVLFAQDCPPWFDPLELFGSCGCTIEGSCNYEPNATYDDDDSCVTPEQYYNCQEICINDMDADGVCDELENSGCIDINACNYNSFVSINDESCVYITDPCDVCQNNIIINNDIDNDGICDYEDDCVINLFVDQNITICLGDSIELNAFSNSGSYSLDFPNTSQYIGNAFASSSNNTDFNIIEDFTIEFWLQDQGAYYWSLMGNNSYGDNSQGWLLKKPGSNLMFAWTYDPNEFNFHDINLGVWEHIAVCYDDASNKFRYFKNGELITIEEKDADIIISSYDFIIGHELGTENWFRGKIDNLRISNISRYTENFDPFENFIADSNTIAMYNFNEGVGNIAYDTSGNDRHLNLTNTNFSQDTPNFNEIINWSNGDSGMSTIVSPSNTTSYILELYNQDFNCYDTAEIVVSVTLPDNEFYDCDNNCLNDFDNDGICDELEEEGCMDNTACNYSNFVFIDDGSCVYPEAYYNCNGNCINDIDLDLICDEIDSCIGQLDECGECNGNGPEEFYDCEGICLIDEDLDGICDEIDQCIGYIDECGECNGNGPEEFYDCNNNCINDTDNDEICDELECNLVLCDIYYQCVLGDCVCSSDLDEDGVCDELDCSPETFNPLQDCSQIVEYYNLDNINYKSDLLGREVSKNTTGFILIKQIDGKVVKTYIYE